MKDLAHLSIDFKKNRIRVHKSVLHSLGDPKYIQLLVNPTSMEVAIRCIDIPLSGEPTHQISEKRLKSDNSYEIYSLPFLYKLAELVPETRSQGVFHLAGKVFTNKKMAIFSLTSMRRIDAQGGESNV